MLSRVAEAIYWMCRYIERAENVARFIDVNLHLMLDLPVDPKGQWEPLITVTGDHEIFQKSLRRRYLRERHPVPDLRPRISQFHSCQPAGGTGKRAAGAGNHFIGNVGTDQPLLSDGRRCVSADNQAFNHSHQFFEDVKLNSHLVTGLMEVTMSHGESWHFARMGHLLERADKTSRVLDVKYFILLPKVEYVNTPYDNIQWAAVLKSVSGLEMYRKQYHRINPNNVCQFLIFDSQFPRAIRYCLACAETSLYAITGNLAGTVIKHRRTPIGTSAGRSRLRRHQGGLPDGPA